MIAGYLFSSNDYVSNFVSKQFISDLWNKKIKAGDEKRAKMLWTLFALEVWHKKVYTKA
jgi:asparagine synthase (glutamine-hydrolysing)